MNNILSAILGFVITVIFLLILFHNCRFSIGCGQSPENRERMTDQMEEVMMKEITPGNESGRDVSAPPPMASDNLEGFASIDASGSEYPESLPEPMHKNINTDNYYEHPIHPMSPHDPMGKGHGNVNDSDYF
jgi:hypothetical protein